VLSRSRFFYELDPYLCDRTRAQAAGAARTTQPVDAAEGLGGAPGEPHSRAAELEEEGENPASTSAPERLPNSPQSPSTPPRAPSESGGRAEDPGSLPRRSRRTSSNRPRTQGPDAYAEVASQLRDADTRDLVAFLRERADKEHAIAQQRVDNELAIAKLRAEVDLDMARPALLEKKAALTIMLKNDLSYTDEQCQAFLRDPGL
jgi:hypothetical protein